MILTFTLGMAAVGRAHALVLVLRLGAANKDRVIGMGLYMLLEVLGALERLPAEVTLVWLERDMDADVRRDVVPFDSGSAAARPLARQIQVVGALPADMPLTDMVLGRVRNKR